MAQTNGHQSGLKSYRGLDMETVKRTASQAADLDQLLTTTISRMTLWEWRRKGLVPAPLKLGMNRLRWRAEDVRKYLLSRPTS
jgi:predicted DNA-binding transcriptional regulator AlpA